MYRDFSAVQHIIGSLPLPSAGTHSAAAFMLKRPVCETTDPSPPPFCALGQVRSPAAPRVA